MLLVLVWTVLLYLLVIPGEHGRWGIKFPGLKWGLYSEKYSFIFILKWNFPAVFSGENKINILKKKRKVGTDTLHSVQLYLWREFQHEIWSKISLALFSSKIKANGCCKYIVGTNDLAFMPVRGLKERSLWCFWLKIIFFYIRRAKYWLTQLLGQRWA